MRGFTLTELLATIAVAAILAGVGVPNLQAAARSAKMVSSINALTGSLHLARSEAVKQGVNVSVCARATAISCGNDWSEGWLVFQDSGPTPGVVDNGESILSVNDELPAGINLQNSAIIARSSGSATARTFIRFKPRGSNSWHGGGTFTNCDSRGASHARALNIAGSGIISRARKSQDGKRYDVFGAELVCPTL